MVGGGRVGCRARLEELFDAAELCGGEVGEVGEVGGELVEDLFFVGDSHHNDVEVAVKLFQHGVAAVA